MKKKKILTLEDLALFCQDNGLEAFSSKDSGYTLSVQSPALFETKDEVEDETMLFAYVKLFHTGVNRNKSSVTLEAAKKSLEGIKYKPILADFTNETPDGETDFTNHAIEVTDDGEIEFIERQVGCFTADEPYIEHDDKTDRDYVYARIAIPTVYTETADIIKRKNGTLISAELVINEMNYKAKEKLLELTDITVRGATLLGYDPERKRYVREGMEGAKVSLTDFSEENNSIINDKKDVKFEAVYEELVNSINDLKESIDSFNKGTQKGGTANMGKFEELLAKYNKTVEDIEFDHENMTDEELEAKFAELFENNEETETPEVEATEADTEVDNVEEFTEEEVVEEQPEETKVEPVVFSENGATLNFEVTFNNIQEQIWRGVHKNIRHPNENSYYYVRDIYPSRVVVSDNDFNNYAFDYSVENEKVESNWELYPVFIEVLNEAEKAQLETMRSNFEDLSNKVSKYEKEKEDAEKASILNSENYSDLLEEEEFKSLIDNKDNYTIAEFSDKAKIAFAECVQRKGVKQSGKLRLFSNTEDTVKVKKRYGNIFN